MIATAEEKLVRHVAITRAQIDEKKRTVVATLATEYAVERSYGSEVLLCRRENVDMERADTGIAVLLNHDTDKIVGVTLRVWCASDRTVKCEIQFGNSAIANEAFQDVKDGILRYVSVGYIIENATEGDDGTLTASRWCPMECSLVAVPADPRAVIGRNKSNSMSNQTADTGKETISLLASQYATRHADKKEIINRTASTMELEGKPVADFKQFILDEVLSSSSYLPDVPIVRSAHTSTENSWRAPGEIQITESLGDSFVRSQDYQKLRRGDLRGRRTINVECKGTLNQHLTRSTLLTTGLTSYDKRPGVVLLDQQPPRIAELFSNATTGASTVRYSQENSYTQAATAVAEEGLKPEATFDLEEVDVAVKKMAVIGRVSDEQLNDHDYTANYITNRLAFMLASLEDNHLLNGTGNSNQILGILNVSGTQTQSGTTNPIDSVYRAMTKVRTGAFLEPDGIIFHPNDWMNFVLTKDGNGQYLSGGAFPAGAYGTGRLPGESLWNKPVILTTAIAAGTALVGSFRMGATIFRRQGVTIDSTNSDGDDFKYNRTAFRAEQRLALVPFRPSAFCIITGIPQVGA